jgi:hypothetical protein
MGSDRPLQTDLSTNCPVPAGFAGSICGAAGWSSGFIATVGESFAGRDAIAAEPNVVILETLIGNVLFALSQRRHYQDVT